MIPLVRTDKEHRPTQVSLGQQVVRFVSHVGAIYLIVWFITPWVAGRWYDWILPLLQSPENGGRLQFMFSHVFALTFLPGLMTGFINAKYRHKAAFFVWTVPLLVLLYRLITFPTTALQEHWPTVFHYYFAGDFLVPDFQTYRDLFSRVAIGSDFARGMAQIRTTGAFYAGVGYTLAALASMYLRDGRGAQGVAVASDE
jgi:hypothetical protein